MLSGLVESEGLVVTCNGRISTFDRPRKGEVGLVAPISISIYETWHVYVEHTFTNFIDRVISNHMVVMEGRNGLPGKKMGTHEIHFTSCSLSVSRPREKTGSPILRTPCGRWRNGPCSKPYSCHRAVDLPFPGLSHQRARVGLRAKERPGSTSLSCMWGTVYRV